MDKLNSLLTSVYKADQVSYIEDSIQTLIETYSAASDSDEPGISEKDVCLITYGDQVFKDGENKLRTLHQFLNTHLDEKVTKVHLLPFFPYTSDDGFSVTDYYAVNEELGDWDDIESISKDFDIMFDAVINHVSSESDWFKSYLEGDSKYQGYFIESTGFDDTDQVVRPRTSPLFHDFDGKKVWTTFSRDQIDINYAHPDLFLQILDVLLFYVSKGAKQLRLDAIGFMWKEDGTTCIHLPQTHALIQVMRLVIEEVNPRVVLITETNVPHLENISYFGKGDEAHMVYNFTLPPLLAYSILNEDSEVLTSWAKSLELPSDNVCFFNFLSSHDGIGVRPVSGILENKQLNTLIDAAESNGGKVSYRSDAHGQSPYEINCNYFSLMHGMEMDSEIAFKRMILAHALLLTFPGMPAIYFHSMFGMQNDIEGLIQLGYNRAINRQKFELSEIEDQLKDPDEYNSRVLNTLKDLIGIRAQHPQFHPLGRFDILECQPGVFGIKRYSIRDQVQPLIAYFNLSSGLQSIPVDNSMKSIIDGRSFENNTISLEAYQFDWLVQFVTA